MRADDNVTMGEVVHHLRNWNFSWNVILTIFLVVLQYGNFKYSRFLYGLKMTILWLLWPIVLALSIFDAWANFNVNWVMFAFSILLACITFVLWVMYFVNSIKLWRRTSSWWAFNPETDAILTTTVLGRNICMPVHGAPTSVTLTLLNGTLLIEGYKAATGLQIHNLPSYVTVAKSYTTVVYNRVGKSANVGSSTGWAFYIKSKHGDFSATSNTSSLSEGERLLHLY